jgi:hydroxymethylglutaryl-CoA lyase
VPERVRITDVSPRDGLQNEPGVIPTHEKVRLVELLCATGVDEVEVTSFVSAKWVPQLGDAEQVLRGLWQGRGSAGGGALPSLSVLIPNKVGLEALSRLEGEGVRLIDRVCLFTAASETFSKKNTNASIDETFERFMPVFRDAWENRRAVRVYISCAYGCPFEGDISPQQVQRVVRTCLGILSRPEFGAREGRGIPSVDIAISDTIGAATPGKIHAVHQAVADMGGESPLAGLWAEMLGKASLSLHLHDTFGRAADCVRKALVLGVRSFDGSVAGLGGCPYASTPGKRAPGNIATETLVRTIHDAGYETGVDLDKLAEAAAYAREIVARSRAGGGA